MIIRSRRNSGSMISRWIGKIAKPFQQDEIALLNDAEFNLAIRKECARCDRRTGPDRHFAVILFHPEEKVTLSPELICASFATQLRLTDEIGSKDGAYAILLPETDIVGAENVCDKLASVTYELDLKMSPEIMLYPDDDKLALMSTDFTKHEMQFDEPEELQKEAHYEGLELLPTPFWKRGFDIVVSLITLLVFAPFLILTASAIKIDSPGPIFFRQQREGKGGKVFSILKFRTMRVGAHAEQAAFRQENSNEQDGPAFKLTNDPRVTRIGRYLRKVCLDEMPQILNVLMGDMSLVGPRPLPVSESRGSRAWHRRRLRVLPGLTCIWQVAGRRDISFDDWMRLDMEYIEKRNLFLDVKLLFKTAMMVVMHKGSV